MAAETPPVAPGYRRVLVMPGHLLTYAGMGFDAGMTFDAPVDAVTFAVGVEMLEVVGRPEAD